ncbi:nicotinate-nucleotide--dimethylbenzimidazole phosphoribosyltransferase [Streptomyces edwardsiae]|uniref:Nicotinate-nucleotide--dimethylbenzimidazole phosphoribosyltransferase n=1 Tax=Streptomyces edwardsiae TaxID=3075527 RepID=A0ABU2QJT3_9ACTN|nr:nicotinate-nucleotide--dimethylbenzimidazole phosphoribosyltransferase [Streptomyces sp. DSM 41635]MDT0404702.1 nicotinate-nucleotide--dimethylbenzimidazole phosphoribosyltransferase [Streptomyces sp. DSM 41635]
MTDTGQVPGEGLPENAGMVEQPGVPAPEAYTYLSDSPAEEEDLLLPGAQGAWGNEVAPPAPEPVVETVHEPGPHETAGRDSGSVDLSGVRLPEPPQPAPAAPRRPLHLGPPIPDLNAGPVRSLADRGPADLPARQAGPPSIGPEYLDVPRAREAAPQVAAPWGAQTGETVVPAPVAAPVPVPAPDAVDAAQAVVARVATEAGAAQSADGMAVAGAVAVAVPVAEQHAEGVAEGGEQAVVPVPEPAAVPVTEQNLPGTPVAEPAQAAEAVLTPVPEPGPAPVAEAVAPEPAEVPETPQADPVPVAVPGHAEVTEPVSTETAVPAPAQPPVAEVPQDAPVPDVAAVAVAQVQETEVPQAVQAAEPEPVQPVREPAADVPQVADVPEAPEVPVVPVQAPEPEMVQVVAEPVAPEIVQNPEPAPEAPVPGVEVPAPASEVPAPSPEVLVQGVEVPVPAPEIPVPGAATAVPPETVEADVPEGPAAEADSGVTGDATPVQGPQQTPVATLPGTVAAESEPGRPEGEFVPVDGTVPTTPHLAPTPPQGVTVPAEEPRETAAVPAAPDPELAQDPDDLDTRGAGVDAAPPQPAGPAAPGYDDAEREAVLKVMRERRDIRNGFRGDPIPHEVLLRVLEAAHTAPSVGHSQPWDFVVIRSADTRRSMHELAMRQRDAYAKSLPKGRAKQFKELKIEAILDTPVNIVVTADPTRGGRHTLGRHTQPQMAPYSSALAVENLWLAARAEGLGVGWVSFFDEREMVRALGLPEHLEVVAYLCVGYVDEFPDEPELMQAGWSKRRPLSWVVHEETYGRRALPGEDPHDLLAETVAQIRPLDAKALGEAWERQKRMTKPAGALGMLEIISAQLSGLSRQCPPPIPEPAAVAIFAGDHGVHAQGVTPWPQEVTAQMVANFLGGGAVCNAFAAQVGAEVCVVDVGVSSDLPATPGLLPRKIRAGTSDMTTGPAMTREEAKKAIEVGIETARDLVAAGNKALLTGEMGIANTTASAALISVFTGADPAEVTGRGTGINDETLARKTEVVRRALDLHQPDPADPIGVLAAVGGFEHAAIVGLLLGGASLRTPVILDGVSAGAAALVARAIAPEVLAACIAGHRSAEPGHVAALNKLGLRPLVDLDLRLGEGTGALLALPLVQSTARAMHEVATFDSAGVTEK